MSQTKAQLISDLVQALNFTGTASAPANGAFLSAANTLAFATNSAQRLTIDSTGDVGIGTSSPASLLHLRASSAPTLRIDDSDTTGILAFQQDGVNGSALLSSAGTFSIGVTNDNAAATLTFLTRNNERLRIDSSGRVMIGTTTEGSSASDDFTIASTGTTGMTIRSGTSNNGNIEFSDGTSGQDEYRGVVQYAHSDNSMRFYTDAAEKLRITSSGKLVIGHTSTISVAGHTPALQINGDDYNYATFGIIANSNDTNGAYIQLSHQRSGSAGGATVLQNNDAVGNIVWTAGDGTDITSRAAEIRVAIDGTPGSNDTPGRMAFHTTADGSQSASERMRIDSSGNVGIGTTSPDQELHVKGIGTVAQFEGAGGSAFIGIKDQDDGTIAFIGVDGGSLKFQTSASSYSDKLVIDTSGKATFSGDVQIDGDELFIADSIKHVGDTDTSISFPSNDTIRFNTAGVERVSFSGVTTFNDSGADVNFRIEGDTDENLFFLDAGNNRVGIGTNNPNGKFVVASETSKTDTVEHLLILTHTSSGTTTTGYGTGIRMQGERNNGALQTIGDINFEADVNSGSTISAALVFKPSTSGSPTEKMRLTSAGNLGIGTTSPATALEVKDSADSRITITAGNAISQAGINFADNSGVDGICTYDHNTRKLHLGAGTSSFTDGDLTINSSGHVGIGTTSPGTHLEVSGTTDGVLNLNTTDSRGTFIRFRQGGTNKCFVGCGDGLGAGNVNDLALVSDSNRIIFKANGSERMRIDSAGNLGIGTTSPNDKLQVHGTITQVNTSTSNTSSQLFFNNGVSGGQYRIRFDANSSTVGSIQVLTSSTVYNTTSDYRLKENITTITDGITRLKTLIPRRFNFKNDPTKTVDGFIAHEVTAVPESITGTKDEVATEDSREAKKGDPIYQQIDQSKLVPLLVAAVQELITKVETLEAA